MPIFRRADSPYWWAWGYDLSGARWQRSTKQTSRKGAEQVLRRLEQDYAAPADTAPYPLEAAVRLLIEVAERNRRAPGTIEIHRTKGGHLLRLFGADRDVRGMSLVEAEWYLDRRRAEGAGDHTIEKELRTLVQAIRCAHRRGLAPMPAPLMPDVLRGSYVPRDRWITLAEYPALRAELERVAPSRADHFEIYLRTGLRYSELYAIEARHIDRGKRIVLVEGTKTKGAARRIPLDPVGLEIMSRRAALHSAGPVFPDRWRKSNLMRTLTACAARVGQRPVSTNDLRRTYCSWLANAGVPESTCAKLLGHTSSAMVRRVYSQLADSTLAAAVERLPGVAGTLRDPVIPAGIVGIVASDGEDKP